MIGAGSIVFCKTLMSDIMATPALADSEFALMSLTKPKLRRIEKLAKPNAIMLQYANPMAANCLALGKTTGVPFVGLCHGVQTTLDLIAGYCQVPKNEINYVCGGINHMDWFLKLEHKDKDLYPKLREVFEKPQCYKNEKVRNEMLEAQRKWLPQFKGKKITPKPDIDIPKDCKPVNVPLDPALAIGKRFSTLIEQKTD